MKKIAITGGKGGTGKSVFSLFLAKKFSDAGKKVMLCDCDAECPNDYLLIGKTKGKEVGRAAAKFPKLLKRKCKKCGICVKACRSNAIFQAPGKYPIIIKEMCSGCGACWQACPFGAIVPKEEIIGRFYLNKLKPNFSLFTSVAKPNLEESGVVVRQAKEAALAAAAKKNVDYFLLDTAAGTHCPVINALLGADYSYVVTEPTPMGAYDLELILRLLKELKIKGEVVVNKADLAENKTIEKISKKYDYKVGARINYSDKLAKAYSNGRLYKYNNFI